MFIFSFLHPADIRCNFIVDLRLNFLVGRLAGEDGQAWHTKWRKLAGLIDHHFNYTTDDFDEDSEQYFSTTATPISCLSNSIQSRRAILYDDIPHTLTPKQNSGKT